VSHDATKWAFKQRGLKPAARVVLWTLADCHNADNGCFPSQEFLAKECEMSRSSVNVHLDELEARGLIRRENSIDPKTKRQRPTRYALALEAVSENETRPVSEIRTIEPEAVSEIHAEPCPVFDKSRVQNSDNNLVRINHVREPREEDPAFAAFWEVYPRKVGKDGARAAWVKAMARAGLPDVLSGLKAFVLAVKGAEQRFIPYPATWLNQGRWQDDQSHARNGPRSSTDDLRDLSTISAADDLARLWAPPKAIGQ
jgi:DNA-binding MarR family transcriptional regulator